MSEIDDCYNRMLDRIETTSLSNFSKQIIIELENLGCGKYNQLINELMQGKFDDFHKNSYAFPKMELVDRLQVFGLHDIAKKIIHGGYDD